MSTNKYGHLNSIGHYVNSCSRKMTAYVDGKLANTGVTWKQLSVLMTCLHFDGKVQKKKLIEISSLNPSTVTRLLDRLEKKSYITRAFRENDKRSITIKITKKGKKLVERATPIRAQALDKINSLMSDSNSKLLINTLEKIITGLK